MADQDSQQVHSISALRPSRAEDQRRRMRNYTISMTIRTLAVIGAGLFATVVPWAPGAWICIVLGVVLPYPAVVIANNIDHRGESHLDLDPMDHRALTAAMMAREAEEAEQRARRAAQRSLDEPVIVPGTTV